MCISAHTSTAGAILLDMGSKRLTLPEENNTFAWVVFWFFFGSAVLVWFFSDIIAIVLLYIPGSELQETLLFDRSKNILIIGLTLVLGLLSYILTLKYALSQKTTHSISQETVTDLMLSREQFRKLYDDSPVPYFLMDDAGNIRNPNRAALRFFGGTIEECTAINFYSLITDEVKAKQTMSILRAKVERSVPISQEEMCIRPVNKKKEQYALVSIYSLEHTSPIPFKHLVTLVDVSKEKESERVKTDFLLLASHQLRTPLTTVKWYIDYLLTTEKLGVSATVREYLEQIYIGNERMIELITTLLTVSRIEMGTLAPEYTTLHINEIIDDVIEELGPDIFKRQTKVKINTKGDDALIMDHTMMRIIIHNLLTNAVKYTPVGGSVLVESIFSPHNCTISVKDTGYGIPEDEQEKIFTKMFRATNARKVSTNGTGLGLYLCKAFAEKLGGEIQFSSEEGKGSTFTICLPRVAPGA
jgi:PAS domain S-box-containing protein